ncbi:MAG TPA: hypothetical protein VKA68_04160 [bacterium]|nr:hypothetical protein [bacterium]
MKKLGKFIELYGYRGLLLAIFHPITFLVTNPIRLIQTLRNCRILASGRRWRDYPHFLARPALNSLFYWTRALNLYRYGRTGKSPYLGLGEYDLSRTFHYSLPSLYLYWNAGAVLLLAGISGWWMTHFMWLGVPGIKMNWLSLIMFLVLISNSLYVNAFGKQNYNIAGWIFVPLIFYGWYTQHWILVALAALAASFGSMTVVFLLTCLSLVYSFYQGSLFPVLSMVPAGIKLFTHFWPLLLHGRMRQALSGVARAIGVAPKKAKYVRTEMVTFDIEQAYKLLLYAQFMCIYFLATNRIPVIFFTSFIIWLVNANFKRFADEQSPLMLLFSAGTFTMITSDVQSVTLLVSFWLFITPLFPFNKPLEGTHFLLLPVLKPFDVRPILTDLFEFLAPVPAKSRVLMAFDDPGNRYESVLDGYRRLLETVHYVATVNNIHFMPDWWGIFELNYEGAPDFWGRSVEEVQQNVKEWNAEYIIVYQTENEELDAKWERSGFIVLSRFSWKKYDRGFLPIKPYNKRPPHWWLLKSIS